MIKITKLLTGGVKYTVPSIRILVCETNNCILQGSFDSTTETLGTEYTFDWGNKEELY